MRTTAISFIIACLLTCGVVVDRASAQYTGSLRFQIIEADGFTEIDPEIADVQTALSELFRFQGYRLVAEALIRVGGGGFEQTIAATNGEVYVIAAEYAGLIPGENRVAPDTFHIEELTLGASVAGMRLLETSLSLPTGQTVVVGSARLRGDSPTMILVVRHLEL